MAGHISDSRVGIWDGQLGIWDGCLNGWAAQKDIQDNDNNKDKGKNIYGTYVHIWDGQLGIWDGWAVLHYTVGRMPLGGRRKKTFEITTTTTKTKGRTKTTSFSTSLFFLFLHAIVLIH